MGLTTHPIATQAFVHSSHLKGSGWDWRGTVTFGRSCRWRYQMAGSPSSPARTEVRLIDRGGHASPRHCIHADAVANYGTTTSLASLRAGSSHRSPAGLLNDDLLMRQGRGGETAYTPHCDLKCAVPFFWSSRIQTCAECAQCR
jgi:hypothetical protein